jgi:hypothetical protein
VSYKSAKGVAEVAPETVELVLRLASVSRPRPASYAEIADAVLRATEGVSLHPPLVRRLIARHAPELLASRAIARDTSRPRPWLHDGRRSRLEARTRALIVAKAHQIIEKDDGSLHPAFTLGELGRLSPRRLNWQQVRRLLVAQPGGRELLRVRLAARRGLWRL